jgi:hypothetical protein
MGIGEAAEGRRRSEGEDANRAMGVWEIIDSDNEMYLTSFNK